MNKLYAFTIIKDEGPYLEEWLEFHLDQGFDHFFIYDNASTDNTKEILETYITRGLVTYTYWPIHPGQFPALEDLMEKSRVGQNKDYWTANIDSDEFLFCTMEGFTIKSWLHHVMIDSVSQVLVHWFLYGSNGQDDYQDLPVTVRFTKRAIGVDQHVKSILKLWNSFRGRTIHAHNLIEGVTANDMGKIIRTEHGPCSHDHPWVEDEMSRSAFALRINHYHTKSKEEYRKRCARGRSDIGQIRDFETNWEGHNRNEVEDPILYEWGQNFLKDKNF